MQKLFGKFSVGKKFKVLFFAIAIAVVVAAGIYFVLFPNAQNILNNFFSGPLEAVQAQASIIDEVNTMDTLALEMAGSSARLRACASITKANSPPTAISAAKRNNSPSRWPASSPSPCSSWTPMPARR